MSIQQTLVGEVTDDEYTHPSTLLWCSECSETVLRSERYEHEHDGLQPVEKFRDQQAKEKVPKEARKETQTYRVEFHYEMVEVVTVEAEHESEARNEAERQRNYDGEIMETLHTRESAWGEPSPASIDWLEKHNLLPEDHDVTPEVLERAVEAETNHSGFDTQPAENVEDN